MSRILILYSNRHLKGYFLSINNHLNLKCGKSIHTIEKTDPNCVAPALGGKCFSTIFYGAAKFNGKLKYESFLYLYSVSFLLSKFLRVLCTYDFSRTFCQMYIAEEIFHCNIVELKVLRWQKYINNKYNTYFFSLFIVKFRINKKAICQYISEMSSFFIL